MTINVFLTALFLGWIHPLYLTTCRIDIDDQFRWETHFRIFYDDLEDGIQLATDRRPNLDGDHLQVYAKAVEAYILSHFNLNTSHTVLQFSITRLQREGDIIHILLNGIDKWPKSSVKMKLNILTEVFSQQKNIVEIHFNNKPLLHEYLTKQHTTTDIQI